MSTTVTTQSIKLVPDTSGKTEVDLIDFECSIVQESVKSSVVPQSIESVPDLSHSAGPIPVSTEMTKITTSLPVFAKLATDTIDVANYAVSLSEEEENNPCCAV